jgi:Fe-S-cluster containining protein
MTYDNIKSEDIFKCQKCGDCCKGYGGTFITEKETETIAAHLHMDPDTFVENYCQVSGGKRILAQSGDMYCIFWDGLCTIHPVKPRMCKAWPFIESILVDTGNWAIMASLCPGIRTDVANRIIKKCVARELSKNL